MPSFDHRGHCRECLPRQAEEAGQQGGGSQEGRDRREVSTTVTHHTHLSRIPGAWEPLFGDGVLSWACEQGAGKQHRQLADAPIGASCTIFPPLQPTYIVVNVSTRIQTTGVHPAWSYCATVESISSRWVWEHVQRPRARPPRRLKKGNKKKAPPRRRYYRTC